MKVHLLRHTKPDIEGGICYGQSDIGLSKSFIEDQLTIKNSLENIAFDGVFSSPLKRCMELAQSLCPEAIEIKSDDRLMEMYFGEWEMLSWQDISKNSEAQDWFDDYVHVKCPGGESFMDVHKRVHDFFTMLKKQSLFKQPLIITHAGVIRAAFCIINNKNLKESFQLKIGFGELKTFRL